MCETRSIMFITTAMAVIFLIFCWSYCSTIICKAHKKCQNRKVWRGKLGLTVYYVAVRFSLFKTVSIKVNIYNLTSMHNSVNILCNHHLCCLPLAWIAVLRMIQMFLGWTYAWRLGWMFQFFPYFTETNFRYIVEVVWHGMAQYNKKTMFWCILSCCTCTIG